MKRENVILIVIDSLRADHLSFLGYFKKTSPNLDKFSKESFVFEKAFSTGPITPHSFPSILASIYFSDCQKGKIPKEKKLISEVLKNKGYITAAFTTNPFLSSYFGYHRGWDFFEEFSPSFSEALKISKSFLVKKISQEIFFSFLPPFYYWLKYLFTFFKIFKPTDFSFFTKKRANAHLVNETVKWFLLENKRRPFFIFIHYQDVHLPYLPEEFYKDPENFSYLKYLKIQRFPHHAPFYEKKKLLRIYMKFHLKKAISFYDAGISYLDRKIGELFDFLKRKNLYQNSFIIVTSDHGDEFLEHSGGGHLPKLYNELLHVPLLIKTPKGIHKTFKEKVSLIDLSPTILKLLKIAPPSSFKGKSIFKKREFIFHQTAFNFKKKNFLEAQVEVSWPKFFKIACQSKRWKIIKDYFSDKEEFYDLLNDPLEKNPLKEKRIAPKFRKWSMLAKREFF